MQGKNRIMRKPSMLSLAKPAAALTMLPITVLLAVWECSLTTVGAIAETGADLARACNSGVKQIAVDRMTVTPKRREDPADVIPLSRERGRRTKRDR